MRGRAVGLGWILPLVFVAADIAGAAPWEKLVMPGDLATAHAELESDCTQCHQPFEATGERELCLVCHEDVASDLAASVGLHGLDPAIGEGACRACHPDHRGRDFDITGLDPDVFDHGFTDMPLEGAHAATDCGACHAAGERSREAATDCFSCHREDDSHEGRLGEDCGECHDAVAWKRAEFDHAQTRFALDGAHRDVGCAMCHVGAVYEETPSECVSCHRLDDSHEGGFGEDCGSCHTSEAWKRSAFDHDKTGFALEGHHETATCESCHVEPPGELELPESCVGCHRTDDAHRGSYGEECGDCHSAVEWKTSSFDHERDGGLALAGAHASATCRSCHVDSLETPLEAERCADCHRDDDPHEGGLDGDCGECHTEQLWSKDIRFDHDLAAFPLLGLHALVNCEECHLSPAFAKTDSRCVDCHRQGDPHESRLGPECASCHNPNGWPIWKFDHDLQTSFELHGTHIGAACESCHRTATAGPVRAASDCYSCHVSEDAHRGRFGRSCGSCHGEQDWEQATFGGRVPGGRR